MDWRERSRRMVTSAGRAARYGANRAAHEARVRRLEWAIERQKAAIGKALYPLLETGALRTELPEVQERLARIRELHRRLEALTLGDDGSGSGEPEADEPGA